MEACNYATLTTGISTALLTLSQPSDGIFSRLTMTSLSSEWYQALSPFETLLAGIVILQVFVLRYLQILPLNINQGFHHGLSHGKRKRRCSSESEGRKIFSETFFTLLRRIDKFDCVLRSLCEIQNSEKLGIKDQRKLPTDLLMTIKALRRSALMRAKYTEHVENNRTISERPVITVFEEAVLGEGNQVNSLYQTTPNASDNVCERQYALCPLPTQDIFDLLEDISL